MKVQIHKIATIRITDLTISTLIGINDWEQKKPQDVILNIQLQYDAAKAFQTDLLASALDYKSLKQRILAFVQNSHYGLLEKLTVEVIKLIMEDKRILTTTVRIDKPKALRFAKSVSVEMSARRTP